MQGKRCALLIHGLTGTPKELGSLKNSLEKNGFYCEIPVITGHSTTAEELEQTKWQDWYLEVEKSFLKIKDDFPEIYLAGLSLGSLLATHLAWNFKEGISGMALMSSPFILKSKKVSLLPLVIFTPLRYFYRFEKKADGPGIIDAEAKRRNKSYDRIPIKSIWELKRFARIVFKELPDLKAPALICHSEKDDTADISGSIKLYKLIGSEKKLLLKLENSGHIITEDYEKEKVAKEITNFFISCSRLHN